jgi:hypothetical protein
MNAQIEERESTFINLNNLTFAEYVIIYRINDMYSINELSKIHNKHQLLFQRFESKGQQMNLAFVDSILANILADVTLEVLIKEKTSFSQYLRSKSKFKLVAEKKEEQFFKFKFLNFIHMLLYSDIAANLAFNGKEISDRIYYLKNEHGGLEYFSIYEQSILKNKLLSELKLKIDFDRSHISNQEVKLCLKLYH